MSFTMGSSSLDKEIAWLLMVLWASIPDFREVHPVPWDEEIHGRTEGNEPPVTPTLTQRHTNGHVHTNTLVTNEFPSFPFSTYSTTLSTLLEVVTDKHWGL